MWIPRFSQSQQRSKSEKKKSKKVEMGFKRKERVIKSSENSIVSSVVVLNTMGFGVQGQQRSRRILRERRLVAEEGTYSKKTW